MLENVSKKEIVSTEPVSLENESKKHLNVREVMKDKGCYFVHMVQTNDRLDVSENNESINTRKLSFEDKIDICMSGEATLSTSTIRQGNVEDGTFHGAVGVLLGGGEIYSADYRDSGSVAVSVTDREVRGGLLNSEDDVNKAINRSFGYDNYNEVIVKKPVVAGTFLKLDESYSPHISFEDDDTKMDYSGYGVLDLKDIFDRRGAVVESNKGTLDLIFQLQSKGNVFLMIKNEMYMISRVNGDKVIFNKRPASPELISNTLGRDVVNPYSKIEILDRLKSRGVELK